MKKAKKGFAEKSIYTLGEKRTTSPIKATKIVVGNGSDITEGKRAEQRSKRKLVSLNVALSCVDVAKQKKDAEMEQMFWNVFHCQRKITGVNGVIFGKYCGNRSCTLCMSNRKAEMINKYFPIMKEWEQPYFVTLTVKACSAKRLPLMMNKMVQGFQLIKDRQRKRHKRGTGIKLVGVRTLECNFNPIRKTYNPHFHLIVETKEMAELLIAEWLKQWGSKYTIRKAQDIRPVKDLEKNLIEIIKYGSKVFTDPTAKQKKKYNKGNTKIYAKALYNALKAMKGHRVFDRFGFNNPNPKQTTGSAKIVVDFDLWTYNLKQHDWINKQTGETLTNYTPPHDLLDALDNRIDTDLE